MEASKGKKWAKEWIHADHGKVKGLPEHKKEAEMVSVGFSDILSSKTSILKLASIFSKTEIIEHKAPSIFPYLAGALGIPGAIAGALALQKTDKVETESKRRDLDLKATLRKLLDADALVNKEDIQEYIIRAIKEKAGQRPEYLPTHTSKTADSKLIRGLSIGLGGAGLAAGLGAYWKAKKTEESDLQRDVLQQKMINILHDNQMKEEEATRSVADFAMDNRAAIERLALGKQKK